MKWNRIFVRASLNFVVALSLLPAVSALANDSDPSACIHQEVLPKTMVTQRHQEFDVVLESKCADPVKWTMCIERMDPFTNRVSETLTPSGEIEKGDKFRINLQMKKQEDRAMGLAGYDAFYLNVVYSTGAELPPSCVALECENEKRYVREKMRSNERARQRAEEALNRKMKSECPQSDWSAAQQEKCMSRIQKEGKPELEQLTQTDRELRLELSQINPEKCQLHSVE
jgi:hypothetical protein